MNIVCFGDSITAGHGLSDELRWTGLIAARLPTHHVHNRGVGGHTTAMALDRLIAEVLPLLPGIVLIEFGLNDCALYPGRQRARVSLAEFRANLEEICLLCHAAKGRCLLIANHVVTQPAERQGNGQNREANAAPYNAAIRALAQQYKFSLCDIAANMAARQLDPTSCLHEDGVHLNVAGNQAYADIVCDTLAELHLVD